MVPNDIVPVPDPGRRRLLVSYRVPREDPAYRFIYGRSFVYDDALGAIALTMLGDYRQAEFVLNAMTRLVRPDGSLWFAYNTQNGWPEVGDTSGAIIRAGSVAWVGYAFTYYLTVRAKEKPDFSTSDPLGKEYCKAASAIASFLLANQVKDPSDKRYGLLTGGSGSSTVTMEAGSARPAEVYSSQPVRWVSMEHNIDAWFFLRALGRLTPDANLSAAVDLITARLADLWSDKDGQFFQGILENGKLDVSLPLDGASWGALYLLAQGRREQASVCVEEMRTRFSSEADGLHGYLPYGSEPVYTDERVNKYFFPDEPGKLWRDTPFVWAEGSLGAAVALARTGNSAEAASIVDSFRGLAVAGGIRYASAPVQYQFTDYPSVASTAWYIICVEALKGRASADLFWRP